MPPHKSTYTAAYLPKSSTIGFKFEQGKAFGEILFKQAEAGEPKKALANAKRLRSHYSIVLVSLQIKTNELRRNFKRRKSEKHLLELYKIAKKVMREDRWLYNEALTEISSRFSYLANEFIENGDLNKAIEIARSRDTIIFWRLDRLGCNMEDLITLVKELNERIIIK